MLKRYRAGEEVLELRAVIEAHLSTCDWCRMELRRIEDVPPADAAPRKPQPGGLPDLLTRLRTWESGRAKPEVRGPEIRRRVAREIGAYLGGKAAQSILQPVADDGGNLLPAIQPFLGRFLGRKAASHLSSRIVEVAVVRS